MSVYADQIIKVVEYIKEDILMRLDKGWEVSVDEVDGITQLAFTKCANFYNVTKQTIVSKCTKSLGVSRYGFYDLVKLYLLTDNSTLEEMVVTNMPSDESEPYIRKKLREIKAVENLNSCT